MAKGPCPRGLIGSRGDHLRGSICPGSWNRALAGARLRVLRVELLDDGVVVVLGDDEPPSVREESGVAVVPRSAPHPTRRRRRRGGPDSFRARMTAAVLAA